MATGFEDWIKYRVSNPPLALQRGYLHVQGLSELLTGGRVSADGVSDDPGLIERQLDPGSFLMTELNRLEGVVNHVGLATLIPTRRVDGGTLTAPDTGVGQT